MAAPSPPPTVRASLAVGRWCSRLVELLVVEAGAVEPVVAGCYQANYAHPLLVAIQAHPSVLKFHIALTANL